MMKIDVLTLFPEMFEGAFDASIIKRAQSKGLVEITVHNLRKWGEGIRRNVDDRPYGGGIGMILRVDVIDQAISQLKSEIRNPKSETKTILLDATGTTFNQQKAQKLSKLRHLILIAGHYEGVDHRVHEHLADEVISIGDYVLTGGEIPAMVLVDSITRLIPGVLEKKEAIQIESFSQPGVKEFPQYTRPEDYKGWRVPKVLLSGNHAEIGKWRKNN
jgi:tRNA (guanine37-N1)-methyltransferase